MGKPRDKLEQKLVQNMMKLEQAESRVPHRNVRVPNDLHHLLV